MRWLAGKRRSATKRTAPDRPPWALAFGVRAAIIQQ